VSETYVDDSLDDTENVLEVVTSLVNAKIDGISTNPANVVANADLALDMLKLGLDEAIIPALAKAKSVLEVTGE